MFSFGNLQTFGGWVENGESRLNPDDIAGISSAKVSPYEYGLNVIFTLVGGGYKSIVLSNRSKLKNGDTVDPSAGKVITLSKQGEEDIYRWLED